MMNLNTKTLLVVLISSLILLLLLNQETGFVFTTTHSYEIGSIRKPREMQWTVTNWKFIIPLISSTISIIMLTISMLNNRKN